MAVQSVQSVYVCNYVKRRKYNLIQIMGGRCLLCGFDKFQEALEFHHVNPQEKEFSLTSSNMKNLADQLIELKKCVLLCANCHRGVHAGYYNIPDNWQDSFNEKIAQDLLAEKEKKKYYCHFCGKEISYQASLCKECSAKQQQRVERPTREELKKMIREKPFTQIGQFFGVSDNAIRKWCKANNLPSKKKDINAYTDEEWSMI